MSGNISIRIDLGSAKLEFAGVTVEQPIGITLELPREKIAEIILNGCAEIRPNVGGVVAPAAAVVAEQDNAAEPVVEPEPEVDRRRREVSKLTSFNYDDLREKLSSTTTSEAAADLGVSVPLVDEYRQRLGVVEPIKTKEQAAPKIQSPSAKKRGPAGKLSHFGDDYLREKLSTMPVPFLAREWGVSEGLVYKYRRILNVGSDGTKPAPAEVAERQSLTDYSDIELRQMLSQRQWSSIAFDHEISITAVIAEGKRLGVQQPAKTEAEVSHVDTTFRRAARAAL